MSAQQCMYQKLLNQVPTIDCHTRIYLTEAHVSFCQVDSQIGIDTYEAYLCASFIHANCVSQAQIVVLHKFIVPLHNNP